MHWFCFKSCSHKYVSDYLASLQSLTICSKDGVFWHFFISKWHYNHLEHSRYDKPSITDIHMDQTQISSSFGVTHLTNNQRCRYVDPSLFDCNENKTRENLHVWKIMWSVTTTHYRGTSIAYSDSNKIFFIITYHDEGDQI